MTTMSLCGPLRDSCFHFFPCLSDPARRSTLCLKVALLLLHLIYGGVIFLLDRDLIENTRRQLWYTAMYLLLFFTTLAQYFFTSGSSPGYVLDAMRALKEREALFKNSIQPASSKNESVVVTVDRNQLGRNLIGNNVSSWTKMVMDMYPPASSPRTYTCSYCQVVQPPRSKHCHDCDRCVLQFDHHCVWLGTCIGQNNHCRFWWYICEETALCIWTGILYISYLKANITNAWWIDVIVIVLLIVLFMSLIFLLLLLLFHTYLFMTNQTTYELVRRRRIPYLRGIPERVHPFSKGVCRNVFDFCFARNNIYAMEKLPTPQQIEEKSKPYTCLNVLSCRCC
jgi:palmitoyltransferase